MALKIRRRSHREQEMTAEQMRAFDEECASEYARRIGEDMPREERFRQLTEQSNGSSNRSARLHLA